jgi:hypothetical protein
MRLLKANKYLLFLYFIAQVKKNKKILCIRWHLWYEMGTLLERVLENSSGK